MRTIFVGAGSMSLRTAKTMVERRHEVVIVELSHDVIARVQDEVDCGCLQGDGTRPRVLREADPAHADVLFCLTGNDQTNLIASLVGRSLGIPRVITRINDEEFEHVCLELGLQDLVLPTRTIGRYLAHMAEGHEVVDLSAAIRGEARIFMFVAGEAEEGVSLQGLELPPGARVALLYRNDEFEPAEPGFELRRGDEVVIVTPRRQLEKLQERWGGPVRAQ